MLASLPVGAKMIATGVSSPFLVPMKVTLVLALILALPWVFYQAWAFIAPGLYAHEKRLVLPLVILVLAAVHRRRRVLLFLRVRARVPLHHQLRPDLDRGHARHRELPRFRDLDVPGLRRHLRGAGGGRDPGADGLRQRREAEVDPSLHHRRRLRDRRRSSRRRTWSASWPWPFRCACCSSWACCWRRCSCASPARRKSTPNPEAGGCRNSLQVDCRNTSLSD
jgi:hypothetical protein